MCSIVQAGKKAAEEAAPAAEETVASEEVVEQPTDLKSALDAAEKERLAAE